MECLNRFYNMNRIALKISKGNKISMSLCGPKYSKKFL